MDLVDRVVFGLDVALDATEGEIVRRGHVAIDREGKEAHGVVEELRFKSARLPRNKRQSAPKWA